MILLAVTVVDLTAGLVLAWRWLAYLETSPPGPPPPPPDLEPCPILPPLSDNTDAELAAVIADYRRHHRMENA